MTDPVSTGGGLAGSGPAPGRTTRRGLFVTVGSAAAAGVAGWMLRGVAADAAAGASPTASPSPDATPPSDLPDADRRPGITLPAIPQRRAVVEVLSVAGATSTDLRARVASALASLPEQPADAGEVTVTIGFSPEHARRLWPDRAAGAASLPRFASDSDDLRTGGDVAVQVCAETAAAAGETSRAVREALGATRVVWSAAGYRDAPTREGTARTSTGFVDGIVNPRTPELLAAGVWSDPQRRDTHWILRRMRVDAAFAHMPTAVQERAIGRRRASGAPLSGGAGLDDIDLFAKQPDGELLVPLDAHARRAHPSNIGRPLMLRRSYSVDVAEGMGLLFVAFLADPTTFVLTQRRLDEQDALLAHTSTDASGCFFVPGEL